MNDTEKQMVIARFLQAGVSNLQARLGTCVKELADDVFKVTFYTGAGETIFELNLEKNIDQVTLNIEGFTLKHQPSIVVPEIVVSGINTLELEARIKSLGYIRELEGGKVAALRSGIQRDLDALGGETKPAPQTAYQAFLAKYYQQFNFGAAKMVQELRARKLDALYREKDYSLIGKSRILPMEAFEDITSAAFRMPKRSSVAHIPGEAG